MLHISLPLFQSSRSDARNFTKPLKFLETVKLLLAAKAPARFGHGAWHLGCCAAKAATAFRQAEVDAKETVSSSAVELGEFWCQQAAGASAVNSAG